MRNVVALHTIIRCKRRAETNSEGKIIRPVITETIPAGQIFEATDAEFTEWMTNDAIRPATETDILSADEFNRINVVSAIGSYERHATQTEFSRKTS